MTRSEDQEQPRASRERRRVVIAAAAAAVALAVAAPVALSWGDDEPTAPPARGSDPVATPSETTGPARATLAADVAADGEPAQVPYVADGDLVLGDGSRINLERDVSAVAPFGERWIAAHQEGGQDLLTVLAAEGQPVRSFPGGPSLAVSGTGLVATEDPDGQVVVGLPGTLRFTRLKSDLPMQDVEVVAITGTGDCSARDTTCAVYYNEHGDLGGGFRMRSSGPVWQYTRFRSIVAASSEGIVAGELAPDRGRRCTGVFDGRERRLWATCEHSLSDFSPDARLVVGVGIGAEEGADEGAADATTTGLSVLDARTGAPVAEFAADSGTPLQVGDVVWESTTSLLATVRADDGWSLLRLTTDGGITKVADLGAVDGDRPPVRFPLTP